VPAVVKPATATSYLTEAVAREIIASGILPEGSLQLICGSARSILDTVDSQDVVTFTGSAVTGRMLKAHPRIISEAVPFNMEADSLNCSVLGEDAVPGTPEFDLFIKEVRNEMTSKCGQKCTAIRRIIVPEKLVEDVQIALGKALSKVTIGNPKSEGVRMGALASKDQVTEVKDRVKEIAQSAEIVYGNVDKVDVIDANFEEGAFLSPILLLESQPFKNTAAHEVEAFTYDDNLAAEFTVEAATHHGRILIFNRDNAKLSTGHGSPLPTLVHGGPGRAGGGEEMGGMRGVKHYMQRCAVQGTPNTITAVTGIYQQGADYNDDCEHPFKYHFEDIKPGMSLKTHKRTLTDSDIINFSNLTWDHFYAHTDITALEGTIFEKRAVHGYFILAAAAGLFVYPNKGPVAANYGLDECRFLKPLYHNDTVYVRLTCKEKQDRDVRGKQFPSGVVKWLVEVFDQNDEKVALATVLTMVKKKSPFADINRKSIEAYLKKLTEESKAKWGMMTPQHMVEHLEYMMQVSTGKIEVEILTPEDRLEKYEDSLWNYREMPKNVKLPTLDPDKLQDLRFGSLAEAKKALLDGYDKFEVFFSDNPGVKTKNIVFGNLDKFHWELLNTKHFNHHFKQFGLL